MCGVSREVMVERDWDGEKTNKRRARGEGESRAWWGRWKDFLSAKFFNSNRSFNSLSHSRKYELHSTGEKTEI